MQEFLLKHVISWFHKITALLAGLVSLIILFASVDGFLSQIVSTEIRFISYALLLLVWSSYWMHFKWRLQRNKKNGVGIVIAVFSQNDAERQKLKFDFVSRLKKKLLEEKLMQYTNIIFLKNHISEKIKESENPRPLLEKINRKIKAHFYVWGEIKKRKDGDDKKEKYFFYFQGYVTHSPVPKSVSDSIGQDFSKVLPAQVSFWDDIQMKGFEITADFVHLAIRYIVGVAAFVSRDPFLALELHKGLDKECDKYGSLPLLQEIRDKTISLLSVENLWISRWEFLTKKKPDNKKVKEQLRLALDYNPKNYGAWLFKAIIDFLVDGDYLKAMKSVEKAKKFSNGQNEWLYSRAFLYFWDEKYARAMKDCKRILQQSYEKEEITLKEVRDFNLNILKDRSDKPQLCFWIGYLSYKKEENLPNALEDFEKFIKKAEKIASMNLLVSIAKSYLLKIKRKMGI